MTFPETLNEPVFRDDPAPPGGAFRENQLHAVIRSALPDDTIVLTGYDWSSIAGLLRIDEPRVPDGRRDQQLPLLRSVGTDHARQAWHPGLDRAALARLPFPETDPAILRAPRRQHRRSADRRHDPVLVRHRLGRGTRAARDPDRRPIGAGRIMWPCWPRNSAPASASIPRRGRYGLASCASHAPSRESGGRYGVMTT